MFSFTKLWSLFRKKPQYNLGDQPLHGELLSPEQLTQHARALAAEQKTSIRQCGSYLLDRLNFNDGVLREFNQTMLVAKKECHITPATEWLVDNFYLVEEHIQLVKRHLPKQYNQELPCLAEGEFKGLPRIYSVVLEFITKVDAQADESTLNKFFNAYQSESPLTMGELWAIPIMLRLALIENLQRIATRIVKHQKQRDLANIWIDKLQAKAEKNPSRLIEVVADMAKSDILLNSSFVAEFCQRLTSQNPLLHIARNWLEQRLSEEGQSIENLIHAENQCQAASQLSVSYSIRSLRAITTADWKIFVEQLSLIDRVFAKDPEGVYARMDFTTRDRYRHEVETLARQSSLSEEAVAMQALQLARDAHTQQLGSKPAHVGFYLIDEGRHELERTIKVKNSLATVFQRTLKRYPLTFYNGSILLISLLGLWALSTFLLAKAPSLSGWAWVALILLGLFTFSQMAVSLVNRITLLLVKPHLLGRLDFAEGIHEEYRTAVVIPSMLTDPDSIDKLLERLELHFLANEDEHLHFVLLTDFCDAPEEALEADSALLEHARQGIQSLNKAYSHDQDERFFLFHRPRLWNPEEGIWMGYERKRGKLSAFNAVLLGASIDQDFSLTEGNTEVLKSVKFVITLDSDTQLPIDTARKLVGTLAHPLNRPELDPKRNIIVKGYGILQPRMSSTLLSHQHSRFARMFSGEAGIDPYTRAISDVYQDLFEEGSFVGKGIYDVQAFDQTLRGRFPENRILSHDLIESAYARSALISDVELYEDFPSGYHMDASRRHRWIRGDWQIAHWLLPRVPLENGQMEKNPLSCLARWKLFDNLRRSLFAPALLILLVSLFLMLPQIWWAGPAAVLTILAVPILLGISTGLLCKPRDHTWWMHLREVGNKTNTQIKQTALLLVLLPYEAYLCTDAIIRSLTRLTLIKRHLLQWKPSSDVERASPHTLTGFYLTMGFAPIFAVVSAVILLLFYPEWLPHASLALVAWFFSPWIAWTISQPIQTKPITFTPEQSRLLRRIARKTWHFFDTFVTADENWLPPDNFQTIPEPTIASRTSPTNIGMSLLANVSAFDFGYISAGTLIERTGRTLATMGRLKKFHNHLYNWYDTRTLEPMAPLYVSSVDSGNLAGHLLTLEQSLRELEDSPVYNPQIFSGLLDTVHTMQSLAENNATLAHLQLALEKEPPASLRTALHRLQSLQEKINEFQSSLSSHNQSLQSWVKILQRDCNAHLEELLLLAPWLQLPPIISEQPDPLLTSLSRLDKGITLRQVAELEHHLCVQIEEEPDSSIHQTLLSRWLPVLRKAAATASKRLEDIEILKNLSSSFAQMDFAFLYDPAKKLFTIGYNVTEQRSDNSFYDLLASESRLCSYVAIAQGQVPQEHWFSLSRLLVISQGDPILLSWSGSMFEYLMPLLVMPNFPNTLLDHTCKAAVEEQIAYGKKLGVPWGISESAYNRTDAHLTYQYRAFGIPSIGLKRGLSESLVVAPYATLMALMVTPNRACANMKRLTTENREGDYGFYESIDYTPSHLRPDETSATVYSFMAHHQGMGLVALGNTLHGNPMHRRFMASPMLKSAELLLQERISRNITANRIPDDSKFELQGIHPLLTENPMATRIFKDPNTFPEVHLLSNGNYHVMINHAGGGYSRWKDLAVTRWREDATRDGWGLFAYLHDHESGEIWSTTYQPTLRKFKSSETLFTQAYAEFRQRNLGLEVHTGICVSPEDDIELRRIRITNHSQHPRKLELTSYSEVVIAPQAADEAHPAFSNLFVQTEFRPEHSAILCTRRARSEEEVPPHLLHLMIVQEDARATPAANTHSQSQSPISCETDRARFIGRGRSLIAPQAMNQVGPLSNTEGPVLDPIVSLRRSIVVQPGQTTTLYLALGMAENRQNANVMVSKYQSPRIHERAFELAWTHSQVALHQLNATENEAQLYGKLASALIYTTPTFRASPAILKSNRRGQSDLWSYGISGDVPLVLLRINSLDGMDLVRQMIQAHAYWRLKGLTVEMLILNEDTSVYRQSLHEAITNLISSGIEATMLERAGGIIVRRVEQVPHEDMVLLQAFAKVLIEDTEGSLTKQVQRRLLTTTQIPELTPNRIPFPARTVELPERDLLFHNGLGGFTHDGREYVITLNPDQNTPLPWCNVLANDRLGTVLSERGSAYTWSENAHSYRVTPWNNDPVQDTSGEALYIRDEHTGQFWSPTPQPARGSTPYVIRHGFGYTVFEHTENGIYSELWVYVDIEAPVKFSILKLKNLSDRPRRLSVTGYCEWVLTDLRAKSLLHVQTQTDLRTGALLAFNHYNSEFAYKTAFIDVGESCTVSGDRHEFIGQYGSLAQPAAMKRTRLSGKVGAGLDPCGAVQVVFDLAAGQERQTRFRMGVADNREELHDLIHRFQRPGSCREALEKVWAYWNQTLGTVNVDTPDDAVNMMANGWLLYQTLNSRLRGRSGFYQSGGAYGFRDQLQDVMALVHAEPFLTRQQILRAASRQFREGDVQHWWHPPSGRGVRTHFSDDYLWLPYVTCQYIRTVADTGILDEVVPFLEGRPLHPEEESYYDLPMQSDESATLYEHCVRSIEYGLKFGVHGLPLIGCGDWNDGMNLIGKEGRGESVWLAFFLYDILIQFSQVASQRGDHKFAERCTSEAHKLQSNIEEQAWDGQWYRRAYFDNGKPIGSKNSPECQIDSLPQSWSVISGAGDPQRSSQAMAEVDAQLVNREDKLIQLFTPPFDTSSLNPGYIKGYIPGVRENGGQYTHAAIWTTMAFALMGDTTRAWELFSLLNPIRHGSTAEDIETYKVEPYVIAADVYGVNPHTGRGGWTWYTGSAAWMYRLLVETLLGIHRSGDSLFLNPRMPEEWPSYKVHYRYYQSVYHITFHRITDGSSPRLLVDDNPLPENDRLPLLNENREHFVEMWVD